MAETTYASVTWTAGDTITEAKMDNMVANDRAVDAMTNGVLMTERSDPDNADVGANNLFFYVKDKGGVSTLYAKNDSNTVYEIAENRPVYGAGIPGTLSTGTAQTTPLIITRSLTIVKVYAYATTAPVGADLIVDINKNGTSIWASTQANRVTISDGNNLGTQTSFDTTALSDEDILTIDIDQVGSGTAGADLTVEIRTK